MRFLVLWALIAAAGCTDAPGETSAAAPEPEGAEADSVRLPPPAAEAVIQAMASLPTEGLWPGFAPATIPVLLFDGERTLLVAHPAPPADFVPVPDLPGVRAYPGRHPVVRGNMPTELEGVRVAAVMLNELHGVTADRAAAVVAHERFHVHQLTRHPDWTTNELAIFQHPATDAQQLFDRRLETLALYRSVSAPTLDQSECWLRTALLLRQKRMAQLPPAVAAYERGIERQEGLARYIERRAAGIRTPIDIAPNDYPPEEVRGRAYTTGETLALMLDRYSTGWRDAIENAEDDPPALDSLLWLALAERPEMSCGFSAAERAEVLERANAAVAATRAERDAVLSAFEAQRGWSVRVISEATPLWPQAFDPMSITRVASASLVHERQLRAGNDHGYIDVFGRRVLSNGYLDDPLGSGMREILVRGLAAEPTVIAGEDGSMRVTGEGLEAAFEGAHLTRSGTELVIRLR